MRKHTAARAAACAGVLAATVALPATRIAFAAECLASPQGATPAGHHWYYRLDHASQRKCWYLKRVGATAEKKPAPRARQAVGRSDDEPTSSVDRRRANNREALFQEFLRWQKQQESRR